MDKLKLVSVPPALNPGRPPPDWSWPASLHAIAAFEILATDWSFHVMFKEKGDARDLRPMVYSGKFVFPSLLELAKHLDQQAAPARWLRPVRQLLGSKHVEETSRRPSGPGSLTEGLPTSSSRKAYTTYTCSNTRSSHPEG